MIPMGAQVVRGATTRIHVPDRLMPIVVVPGIMGSRLSDERTGKLVFNPTGVPFGSGPRAFVIDYDRLNQPATLIPDEKHGHKGAQKRQFERIRHHSNIVGKCYDELVLALADLKDGAFSDYGVKPVVYCCGYDWRQDNARSALRLAEVVEEALTETRAHKVIIVAHSMGGLVARYYCRALGGESRVHALFLLGSPTLGSPPAYVKLREGLEGGYLRDRGEAIDTGDGAAIAQEAVHLGSNLLTGASALASREDPMELTFFLYWGLCMGAGRMLTRNDTRYFLRQHASIYQLMPNALYCERNPYWVVFDPMATGHPPTGFMLVLPTLLEAAKETVAATLEAIGGKAAAAGEELRAAYGAAMTPGAAERTSRRAFRNRTTLAELAEEIAEAWKKLEEKEDGYQVHKIYEKIRELWDRADESFLDCRAHEEFYRDIYTGLLDRVEHRPICAANIELALRFERALIVGEGSGHESGVGLMRAMLRPLLGALGVGGRAGSGPEASAGGHGGGEHRGPKAYMHPRTFNAYSNTEQVPAGCILIPTEILSNDDSNEVRSFMIPFPIGMPGDGTVPMASAQPSEDQLSHNFETSRPFPGVAHASLASDGDVIDWVKGRLDALVKSFCGVAEERSE